MTRIKAPLLLIATVVSRLINILINYDSKEPPTEIYFGVASRVELIFTIGDNRILFFNCYFYFRF